MTTALAAVSDGPGSTSVQEFDVPDPSPGAGWLRVEATGVCGSDAHLQTRTEGPTILGHEIVGTVDRLSPEAADRWGLAEGERLLLEEYLPCGHCAWCRTGDFRLCDSTDLHLGRTVLRYGMTPVAVEPALWGGYGQYLYLHPRMVFHRVPPGVAAHHAPLALPLSNGFEWVVHEGGAGPGRTAVVIGPGQQGLACVVAAKEAGADLVISVGLSRDEGRLKMASLLGADVTIDAERESVVDVVSEATAGRMADLVVDAAAGSAATLNQGLSLLRKKGVLVCAIGRGPVEVDMHAVRTRAVSVRGLRGHSWASVEWALQLLASGRRPYSELSAGTLPLSEVDEAIGRTAAGEVMHVSVDPWAG
ncbi:MAG TPA: alcohol dehydrogenase catalytic domain-containing protein [Acidimicrobiales bacterium]|nr:alcohol dehydrogenase catalytic domain-containing protein [Acidimicrobiales bacterium]